MADIGTDHALLPCDLVINGIVPCAVAVEVNEGPYAVACQQVRKFGLDDLIDVRLGDGLTVVRPDEVKTIVLAGMGAPLMLDVLEAGKEVLADVTQLVLQPNVAASQLRFWMLENGWQLTEEDLVYEHGYFYEILVATQGDPMEPYRKLTNAKQVARDHIMEIGPLLWQCKHPVLRQNLESVLTKQSRILKQMPENGQTKTKKKRENLIREIGELKELIACLPKESISSASSTNLCHRS